jgi:predicted dehydrogenase
VKVYAESAASENRADTTDDQVFISMRHANGCVSSVSYQSGGDRAFPGERVEVFGGGKVGTIDHWGAIELWSGGRRRTASGGRDKGHSSEFKAFLDVLQHGGSWPIDWDDIRATTLASFAAVRSLRDGEPVWTGELLEGAL